MPLLLQRKVAFIHIPKTGGTTIEKLLSDAFPDDFCLMETHGFGPPQFIKNTAARREIKARCSRAGGGNGVCPQHWPYDEIKRRVVPDLDEWWAFTFVRSPWSRLFSEYRYLKKIMQRTDKAFHEWVPHILTEARRDPNVLDNHIRPQSDFVSPRVEIFHFENFTEGVRTIASRLGIEKFHVEHRLKSGNAEEFRSTYNDQTKKLVADFYRQDIEKFGYESE